MSPIVPASVGPFRVTACYLEAEDAYALVCRGALVSVGDRVHFPSLKALLDAAELYHVFVRVPL